MINSRKVAPVPVESFNDYVSAFYIYVIENLNRTILIDEDWKRTISISSGGVGPKIRKLSTEQKDTLVNNGRKAVSEYFARSTSATLK